MSKLFRTQSVLLSLLWGQTWVFLSVNFLHLLTISSSTWNFLSVLPVSTPHSRVNREVHLLGIFLWRPLCTQRVLFFSAYLLSLCPDWKTFEERDCVTLSGSSSARRPECCWLLNWEARLLVFWAESLTPWCGKLLPFHIPLLKFSPQLRS